MTKMILLYITNESVEAAKKIARHLLEKQMIGCANIFPIESMYWWDGKIADDKEVVLIVKTTLEKELIVRTEIEKIHPFDTPCIIKIDVEPNAKYFDWIKSVLD